MRPAAYPSATSAIRFGKKKNTLELSWQGKEDPLEPTAKPREYIVYTRIGRGGFDNGVRVSSPFPYRKNRTGHRLFLQSNRRESGRRKLPFGNPCCL